MTCSQVTEFQFSLRFDAFLCKSAYLTPFWLVCGTRRAGTIIDRARLDRRMQRLLRFYPTILPALRAGNNSTRGARAAQNKFE